MNFKNNQFKKHLSGCHEQAYKKGHICPAVIFDPFYRSFWGYGRQKTKEEN